MTSEPGPKRLVPPALALLLLLQACGEDTGDLDREAPPAPVMLVKTCDGDPAFWPERGVDADAAGGMGIRLEWDLPEEPEDLAGFLVYRSTDLDEGFTLLDVDPGRFLEGRPPTYFLLDQDPSLRPVSFRGPRAWYFVQALDADGNVGTPSDTASYRLWADPRLTPGSVSVADDTLRASWQYEFVDYFAYGFRGFRVVIVDAAGVLSWAEEIQFNLEPQMDFLRPVPALGLAPGSYRLRVDTIVDHVEAADSLQVPVRSNPSGCSLAGSESYWISFTF